MSEPIVVNQSTSVVQVDTSTLVYPNSAVVLLSTLTAPGTIITIRDITGYASTNRGIAVSTTKGVHYLDGPGCNVYNINQPYGFLTVTPRTSNVWAVINTFAFPDQAAHPSVEGIDVRQGNFSNLSGNTGAFNDLTVYNSTFLNVVRVSSILAQSISTQTLAVTSTLNVFNLSTTRAQFSTVTINNPLSPSTLLEVNGSMKASTIFLTNSAFVRGSLVYNTNNIVSTVQGLGTATYVSTTSLVSTVQGLGTATYVSTSSLVSTVQGLGTATYVSTASLVSTVQGLGTATYMSSASLVSTVQGLGTATYVSTTSLISTVQGLGTAGYLSSPIIGLISTVIGLGSSGYVSSTSLVSTVQGLGTATYVSSASLVSTVQGLGSSSYISSGSLVSTVQGLGTATYVSTTSLVSTVQGLGTATYVSTASLVSTVQGLGTATYVSSLSLVSTVQGLGSSGYISTPNVLISSLSTHLLTVYGPSTFINASNVFIGNSVSTNTLRFIGTYKDGFAEATQYTNTVIAERIYDDGLLTEESSELLLFKGNDGTLPVTFGPGPDRVRVLAVGGFRVDIASNGGIWPVGGQPPSTAIQAFTINCNGFVGIGCNTPSYTLDVAGTINASNIGINGSFLVTTSNLVSTVRGAGTAGYVSSTSLVSTVQGLGIAGYVSSTGLVSTVQGLGTASYMSSSSLVSTVQGLGTSSYISSTGLASTVQGLGSSSYVSSTGLVSTVQGLGTAGYISTPNVSISSLSTYSLTVYGPSTFINASNMFIGASVSTNVLRFMGTAGDSDQLYTNTVIGERIYDGPVGSAGQSSELLLFKGNDNATPFGPDRVRVLSPGGFQVDISTETSWPIGSQPPPTAIQAFYIGCNGRVGINCNSPSYALDVQGSINVSGTINAFGFVNSDNLTSTVRGLGTSSYISSTGMASTVQGLGTSSYISSTGLASTVQGLGTASYISSSSLVSTIQGLGTAGYMSSPVAGLVSTVQGLGSSRYISSPIVALSTLSTQSLIAFGESTFLFSSNVYIGNSFSTNILRFYGTTAVNSFGVNQYARTVIAERSFSNDTSELLLFKANNTLGTPGPDNVRVLAAGGFQVDIASNGGVWPINGNPPSTAIRAFTVNSNGYVGIGCNSPRSTLDVNGIVNVSCNIFVNGLPVVTSGIDTDSNYVSTSNFMIGAGPSTNTLRFLGTRFDGFNDGNARKFTHSVIGERIYAGEELSELLIFKGDNTGCNSWGPDRVRVLSAGGFVVDIAPEGCNWPVYSEPPPPLISNAFSIGRDGVIRTTSTIFINGSRVVTSGGGGGSTSFSSNVGINCNTPVFTLDVDGVINASSTIYVNGNPVITSGGAGGAIVLSCNVGINCNLPTYTLDVNGCLNVSGCNVATYQWIAVGAGTDKILKSSDGYVWSATSGATFSTQGNRVAWNGSNQWIAVGSGGNTIISSTNGNTWTAVSGPTFTAGNDVVWNGSNLWVAVGVGNAGNSIWSSVNGSSWTASSTGFSGGGYGVATSGAYWVAVGSGGSMAGNQKFSGNGITWSNSSSGGFATAYGGRGVAFNGSNMWVAVGFGSSTANTILYSTSGGQLWNNAVTGGFSSYGTSVTWNGSLWVATGQHSSAAGNIQISLDGMNWIPSFSGAFSAIGSGVVWSGTKFIATGTGASSILYSDDGRNWSSCNVSNATFTAGAGIGYGRTLTGPLYALTVSGDTFINGALYINGVPAGAAVSGSGGSGGGGGGGGGSSALPINIELVSSLVGLFGSVGVGCNAPSYSLDVNGTINASSNVFINGSALLAASSLYSTVRGLGSIGYVSTIQMFSLINNSFTSTVRGLGDSGYVSSISLASTIQGLGTAGYLSSLGNTTILQGMFSSIGVNCNMPAFSLDVNGKINVLGNSGFGSIQLQGNGVGFGQETGIYSKDCLVNGVDGGSGWYYGQSHFTGATLSNFIIRRVNAGGSVASPIIQITPGGNIGINCNTPAFSLDVNGKINVLGNSGLGLIQLQGNGVGVGQETGVYSKDCLVNGVDGGSGWYYGQSYLNGGTLSNFIIRRVNAGGSAASPAIQITPGGNIGINCNTPAYTLDVDGSINARCNIYVNGNPVLSSGGAGGGIILGCNVGINCNTPAYTLDVGGIINARCNIYVNGNPVVTSGGAGGAIVLSCNVGINCNAPAYTLDVGGLINARCNIYVNGNPVLTSGGAGSINLGCNVGINCNTPAYTLDVNGKLNVSGNPAFGLIQAKGTTSETLSFYLDPVNAGSSSNTGWITGQTTTTGFVGAAHITTFGVTRVNNSILSQYGYYMTSNGRFGINCNTPAFSLDVNGDIQTSGRLWVNSTGDFTVGPRESSSTRGLLRIVTQDGASFIQSGSNATANGVAPIYFSPINAAGSNSAVMAIDISNARVGINKPNPLYTLDVSGNMRLSRVNNYDRMVFGFSPVESPTGHNWPLISMLVGNANAYLWGDSVYTQPGLMTGFNVHTENGAMVVDNPTFGGAIIEVGLQRGGGTFGGINFIVSHNSPASSFSNASTKPAISIESYRGSTPGNYTYINGDLYVGGSSTSNIIRFRGTSGDSEGNYNTSVIGERRYGLPEQSEILIYKGDGDGAAGSSAADRDRVRVLSKGGFQVDIANYAAGNWDVGGEPPSTKFVALNIDANGQAVFTSSNPPGGLAGNDRGIGLTDITTGVARSGSIWASTNVGQTTSAINIMMNGTGGVMLTEGYTSWAAYSDERLKENIVNIENALDFLKTVRTVKYSLKETPKDSPNAIGFIAQDFENEYPEIVSKSLHDNGMEMLGLRYTEIIPIAVAAIKEQAIQISTLQSSYNTLVTQMSTVMAKLV